MRTSLRLIVTTSIAQAAVRPHVPTTTRLRLLGQTANGDVAVIRNGGAVLTGGPALVARAVSVDEPEPGAPRVYDLTGNLLRWAEPHRRGPHWLVHQVDVTGGRSTLTEVPDEVTAFAGTGWISWDETRRTLVRQQPGARARTLLTGVDDPHVVADARTAAVTYASRSPYERHVLLIDLTTGHRETLATWTPADVQGQPLGLTLTPRDVVWHTVGTHLRSDFHRRARAGGEVTTTPGPPAGEAWTGPFVATDDRIVAAENVLLPGQIHEALRLWSFEGGAWRTIPLPGQNDDAGTPGPEALGGLVADGPNVLLALSGDIATQAGVYAVGTTPTRVATVEPGTGSITDVVLSAGRLSVGERDAGAPTDGEVTVRQRAVGPDLTLGPETTTGSAAHVRNGTRAALSVSGGRMISLRGAGSWWPHVWADDGGHIDFLPVRVPARDLEVRSSGRFFLVDGKHYELPTGSTAPTLRYDARGCLGADLFGATVACSRPDGSVLLTRGGHFTTIPDARADGAVAVWGAGVAWHRSDGTIAYRPGPGAPIRRVAVTGPVNALRLRAGAISWEGVRRALMLIDPETMTVHDSGLCAPGMTDDHLMAGLTDDGQVSVEPLPFGQDTPHPPRLISADTPRTTRGTWRPEFEVTKEVTDVTLTMFRGSEVVATRTGTGVAGDVRGLSWRGAKGTYTWRLTTISRDGEGQLAPVSGTVTVG